MPNHTRLSAGEKFNYAIGEFASNIMFSAISFYLLYFMINVGGLSPFYASVVFLVSRAWDAVTDYLMGILCDYTISRRLTNIIMGCAERAATSASFSSPIIFPAALQYLWFP